MSAIGLISAIVKGFDGRSHGSDLHKRYILSILSLVTGIVYVFRFAHTVLVYEFLSCGFSCGCIRPFSRASLDYLCTVAHTEVKAVFVEFSAEGFYGDD